MPFDFLRWYFVCSSQCGKLLFEIGWFSAKNKIISIFIYQKIVISKKCFPLTLECVL